MSSIITVCTYAGITPVVPVCPNALFFKKTKLFTCFYVYATLTMSDTFIVTFGSMHYSSSSLLQAYRSEKLNFFRQPVPYGLTPKRKRVSMFLAGAHRGALGQFPPSRVYYKKTTASCNEIEEIVETQLCKLPGKLRSRDLRILRGTQKI